MGPIFTPVDVMLEVCGAVQSADAPDSAPQHASMTSTWLKIGPVEALELSLGLSGGKWISGLANKDESGKSLATNLLKVLHTIFI